MKEHDIQNAIRLRFASDPDIRLFRSNVGQAWTGSTVTRNARGDLVISEARPFSTGLPAGWPDLFGFRVITITSEMVGRRVPVFAAIEVKTARGRVSDAQRMTLDAIISCGALAGIAHDPDEAEAIMRRLPS